MQNRYVGDIGDYVKFAILRALSPNRSLGVAWWLYEDEHQSKNGRHTKYLDDPKTWRHYDHDLYDGLREIVGSGIRDIKLIEQSGLLPRATFHNELIPITGTPAERVKNRIDWYERLKKILIDDDLIFLDPDNGLETVGFSPGTKVAGKSVSMSELVGLSRPGRTIIVYHHQTRRKGGHQEEIKYWARRLEQYFETVDAIRAKSFSPRAFFLLNATSDIRERAERLVQSWEGRLSWHSKL